MNKLITLILLFISSLCIAQDTTYTIETVYTYALGKWYDADYGVNIEVYFNEDPSHNIYIIEDYSDRYLIEPNSSVSVYEGVTGSYYYEIFSTDEGYAMVVLFARNKSLEMLMGIYAPDMDGFNFFCTVEDFDVVQKLKLAESMKNEIIEKSKIRKY